MPEDNSTTPFTHVDKEAGDVIRSADWNAGMNEVMRLNTAKVNREGVDLIQGPLTIQEALNANNANLKGSLQAESIILTGELSVPKITATEATLSGSFAGTTVKLSEGLTAASLTVNQATINGPLAAESLTVATTLAITDSLAIGDTVPPTGQTKLSVAGGIQAAQVQANSLTIAAENTGPNTKITHDGLFFISDQTSGEAGVQEARAAIAQARQALATAQENTASTQQAIERTQVDLREAEKQQQIIENEVDKLRSRISDSNKQSAEKTAQANGLLQQAQAFEAQIRALSVLGRNNPTARTLEVQARALKTQAEALQSQARTLQQTITSLNQELQKAENELRQQQNSVKQHHDHLAQQAQQLNSRKQAEKEAEESLEQALKDPRLQSLAYGLDTRTTDSLAYSAYKYHRWKTRFGEAMSLTESAKNAVKIELNGSAMNSPQGDNPYIYVNGKLISQISYSRGINTVILSDDGTYKAHASHDLWGSAANWNEWADFVDNNADQGDIVAVVSKDAVRPVPSTGKAKTLISSISATKALTVDHRRAYALLFVKGEDTCSEVSQSTDEGDNVSISKVFNHGSENNLDINGSARIQGSLQVDHMSTLIQEPWRDVSFLNGWVNYGGGFSQARYFKDSQGIVHLTGLVKSGTVRTDFGTATSQGIIFNLPPGYRPDSKLLFPAMTHGEIAGRIDITAQGGVYAMKGLSSTWVTLEGIHFRAAK